MAIDRILYRMESVLKSALSALERIPARDRSMEQKYAIEQIDKVLSEFRKET